MQDLAGKRLSDLLEKRGTLIRRLIASNFDAGDNRFYSFNRCQCGSSAGRGCKSTPILFCGDELSSVKAAGVLMAAVKFTLTPPQPKSLDIRA